MSDLGEMLETGEGGVARDAVRAVVLYRLALTTIAQGTKAREDCVWGLSRLGAGKGSGAELARLERARLARYDAARCGGGGRTPKQLVALAIAGGPEWDRLASAVAAAATAAAGDSDGAGRGCSGGAEAESCAASERIPVERTVAVPAERSLEVPVERAAAVSVKRTDSDTAATDSDTAGGGRAGCASWLCPLRRSRRTRPWGGV